MTFFSLLSFVYHFPSTFSFHPFPLWLLQPGLSAFSNECIVHIYIYIYCSLTDCLQAQDVVYKLAEILRFHTMKLFAARMYIYQCVYILYPNNQEFRVNISNLQVWIIIICIQIGKNFDFKTFINYFWM